MALQNFVARSVPAITAAWLNRVDKFLNNPSGLSPNDQTIAESAAGVIPTNFACPAWDVRRLGVIGDGVTDDTAALQRCFLVGGDWYVPSYMQIRCTSTIFGIAATRLYSNTGGGIGLGTLSSNLSQAYIVHDFNGTLFDLIGTSASNLISAGFAFERLTFVQKNGNGTGASGSCIRSVQISSTQRCTWLRVADCNFETLSGSVNDWSHGIELDGTAVANPNNLRDVFLSRLRVVSGANATDAISLKGVSNVFLEGIETNLTKADLVIGGGGGNSSSSIFINGCTFNNINLDLASGVYGAGNTASTVVTTANTLNVDLECSCTGSPPTIAGTRVYVRGLHSTGKLTVSANNNVKFDMGANLLETTGPLAVGASPAGSGAVRLENVALVVGRNAANNADVQALQVDANNRVRLAPNGADDIVWGRSPVALGGGAVPTLGTIGGAGPATAAQFQWLQVYDTSGNKCFLPAWK